MSKPKTPLVDIEVKCPHRAAEMNIKVFRTKTSEPAPPTEYEYDLQVQVLLPGMSLASKEPVAVAE